MSSGKPTSPTGSSPMAPMWRSSTSSTTTPGSPSPSMADAMAASRGNARQWPDRTKRGPREPFTPTPFTSPLRHRSGTSTPTATSSSCRGSTGQRRDARCAEVSRTCCALGAKGSQRPSGPTSDMQCHSAHLNRRVCSHSRLGGPPRAHYLTDCPHRLPM
jgi:hypothetical protein